MMAIGWLWTALAVFVAQGVALAADSGYVDASGARIPAGWIHEDKESGGVYVEDPTNSPLDAGTDRNAQRHSSNSSNDLQWRIMKNIEIRLVSPTGKIRGATEIETLFLRSDPKNFWGAIFSSDKSDKRHSMFGNSLRLNWRGGTVEGDTGYKLGQKPLLARDVYVPGKYYVKSFGRLFGEQLISEADTLVTFTEVTHPFTVTGKVLDINGNPVANANVELRNPEGLSVITSPEYIRSNFKGLRGEFVFNLRGGASLPSIDDNDLTETLSAYTLNAITSDSGEWKISGFTMPENAEVYISAPGFTALEMHGLYNHDRPKLPNWDDLLAGDYQTTPVKLLKQGKLRVKAEPRWMDKNRSVEIRLSANGNGAADAAWIKQSREGRFEREDDDRIEDVNQPIYYEMIVPAERAFSLVMEKTDYSPTSLNMGGTKSLFFTVEVEHPLEPGEVREIGPLDFKDASKWKASQAK